MSRDLLDLTVCTTCHSVVFRVDADRHRAWHLATDTVTGLA